ELLQSTRLGVRARAFDNADQRNQRLRRNLIEDNMRRVCRDQAEVCTGPCEFADFLNQVIGHAGEVIRGHEIESLLQINAINDEFRITPVAGALAIKRDDSLIIIDRAFRPKAANYSKGLHLLATGRHPPSPKPTARYLDTN